MGTILWHSVVILPVFHMMRQILRTARTIPIIALGLIVTALIKAHIAETFRIMATHVTDLMEAPDRSMANGMKTMPLHAVYSNERTNLTGVFLTA